MNMVTREDLADTKKCDEIKKSVTDECKRCGTVTRVAMPTLSDDADFVEGLGRIWVQFETAQHAESAAGTICGRMFMQDRVVCVSYYPVDKFEAGELAT